MRSELHKMVEYPVPNELTSLSGQARALEDHDQWILAFGMTSHSCPKKIGEKILHHEFVGSEIDYIVLPEHTIVTRTHQGEVEVRQLLFPGYYFLGVNTPHPSWQEIEKDVPGIFRVLKEVTLPDEDPKPAFLPEEERKNVAEHIMKHPIITIVKRFAVGDRVYIHGGALRSYHGVIVEVNEKQRRAKINVDIHNSVIRASVSLFDLEVKKSE